MFPMCFLLSNNLLFIHLYLISAESQTNVSVTFVNLCLHWLEVALELRLQDFFFFRSDQAVRSSREIKRRSPTQHIISCGLSIVGVLQKNFTATTHRETCRDVSL